MNFHSCHTQRTPRARSSPRLCSNEPKLPPRPVWASPSPLPSSLTLLPYLPLYIPVFPTSPPPAFPRSPPLTFILSTLVSHGEFVIRRLKFRAQRFSFFRQAGEKTPNRDWLVWDRPGLMKSKLSIRAQHLHIGTNEARRSPTLIPLHLTHFIDSPCFPNEMLNISPLAVACWQLLLWRWREWERKVTVTQRVHTQIKV